MSRERSSTEATKRIANQPAMSASLSGPGDFMSPTHYYSASLDSPKPQSTVASNPTSGVTDVQKKDSLSRSRAAARKQPSGGGLARQSLVSDSTSASADSGKTGVQLEDKPVDFD